MASRDLCVKKDREREAEAEREADHAFATERPMHLKDYLMYTDIFLSRCHGEQLTVDMPCKASRAVIESAPTVIADRGFK